LLLLCGLKLQMNLLRLGASSLCALGQDSPIEQRKFG